MSFWKTWFAVFGILIGLLFSFFVIALLIGLFPIFGIIITALVVVTIVTYIITDEDDDWTIVVGGSGPNVVEERATKERTSG